LPKQKRPNGELPPHNQKQKRKNTLLGHILRVFDQIIEYFETLLIYSGKVLRQKLKDTLVLFFLIFILAIATFGALFFFSASLFLFFLKLYQNDPILASLTMGVVYCGFLILVFGLVARKFNRIL